MSKSSVLRIVLLDTLGDVLFSGESLSMIPMEQPAAEAEERCPETLRSRMTPNHESGVYPSVAFANDGAPETLPEYPLSSTDEIRSSRTRAA